MEVKKEDIIRLRKASGQPIMDCKKALRETESFDEAFELLRKTATDKIDERRKDRVASEGRVIIKGTNEYPVNGSKIAMVSLLCETDFTAKSEVFIDALDKIADLLLEEAQAVFRPTPGHGIPIPVWGYIIDEVKAQTGEKIQIGQTHIIHIGENMSIGQYVHFDNKKAALIQFDAYSNPRELQELGKNIAMHIVANKPQFLGDDDVDWSSADLTIPEHLQNKPEEILEKISRGKMNKFKAERCLLYQPYCLDDKITVDKAIKDVRKDKMMEITLKKFRHIEIGD